MVTTSYPRWAGDMAGTFVAGLARHLAADQGVSVLVLAPAAAGAPGRETDGDLQVRRIRYFRPERWQRLAYGDGISANLRRSLLAWLNVPFLLGALFWRLCRLRREADLIHAHWGVLGALAVAARPIHRLPVVLTVHGSDINSSLAPIRGATVRAVRRADVVTVNCDASRRTCDALRPPDRPCRCFPNGIPLPPEETVRARRAAAGGVSGLGIVSVGRLIRERRQDLLLRAFARVRRRFPAATLTLVGDGPRAEHLRGLAGELNLGDSLRMVGTVPTREVEGYLYGASLYVSATTAETFGMAVAEAAARALPVVTTCVGFPGELVVDGQTGCVVPPGDGEALAEAMAKVLALAPAQRREMGRRMRARVEELGMTEAAWAGRFADIYRALPAEPAPPPEPAAQAPASRLRGVLAYAIALALIAGAGVWAARNWDKVEAACSLSPAHLSGLIPLTILTVLLGGLQNRVMAEPLGAVLRLREWAPLGFASGLADYVLPMRAGIAVRAAYLKKRHGLSLTRYASAMTVVYVMTILANCLIGATAVGWIALSRGVVSWPLLSAQLAVAAGCAAALAFSPRAAARHADARFWGVLVRFHVGWDMLRRRPGLLAKAGAIAVGSMVAYSFRLHIAFAAVGRSVGLVECLLIGSLVAISTLVSITPAGLGIREAVVLFTSLALGVTPEVSLLAGAADRAVSIVVIALLGPPATLLLSREAARAPRRTREPL